MSSDYDRDFQMISEDGEKDWAIVVGIDLYFHLPHVSGAVEDARAFYEWLIADGVPREQIALLTSSEKGVLGDDVERVVEMVGHQSHRGRRLYVYAAGTGVVKEGKPFLVVSDARRSAATDYRPACRKI